MENKSLLSGYPQLQSWYHGYSSTSKDWRLRDFCSIINHEDTNLVCDLLADYLMRLSSNYAKKNIEQLEDSCSPYQLVLGDFLLHLGEKALLENAAPALYGGVKSLAESSDNSVYRFIAAWLALNLNQFEECIALCENSIHQNADLFGLKGQAALESVNVDLAINSFEQSTSLAPRDPMQWFWLAKSYYAADQEEEAWDAGLNCFRLHSDIHVAILLSAIALADGKDKQKLNIAWNSIWDTMGDQLSNGYLASVMIEIGVQLRDQNKLNLVTNKLPLQFSQDTESLTKKLPHLLRKLQEFDLTTDNIALIDKLSQIFNQAEPR